MSSFVDTLAAVLDGSLRGFHTADCQRLDAVADRGEGGIADGVGVLGHGVDDVACGGELLTVLAGVLGVGDGLEAVTRAGAGLTADGRWSST